MPNFKYADYFQKNESPAFDNVLNPGVPAPNSGIYRCQSCGFEAACVSGRPLPPEHNCHQHGSNWSAVGLVRWRLAAAIHHQH